MRLRADRVGAKDAATAESFPCKKTARKFQHAREISRYFITRAHAIFRQLFCALIRRITGASARANYRVRTRITLYARLRRLHSALAGVYTFVFCFFQV